MESEAPSLRKPASKPIVLVGLMGVGKTSVGRRLAGRLGLPFVDADEEIVRAANLSIPEIFERYGEAHFRDGERRVITRLVQRKPRVIATGGGAFMDETTRKLILDRAISVWLDANIDVLVERVSRRNDRPLLAHGDPGEKLRALAAIRNPIYAQANIHIQSNVGPHEMVVEKILESLS